MTGAADGLQSSRVLTQLAARAAVEPAAVVLEAESGAVTLGELQERVQRLADELAGAGVGCAALVADNGVAWVIASLACTRAAIPLVPLPSFFSQEQRLHVLDAAGVDGLLTSQPPSDNAAGWRLVPIGEDALSLARRRAGEALCAPEGTAKITFTSGTTGSPQGVCLSQAHLEAVAQSLAGVASELGVERHLCCLPLAVLLEEIGGVLAPLLMGARIQLPALQSLGWTGSSGLDASRWLGCLHRYRPQSLILLPQMLKALVQAVEQGAVLPDSLKLLAVGGARVGTGLLARAWSLGLAVYEGYGLSECGSVVALNRPGAWRSASVGQPLPHTSVRIADDGEIQVQGPRMLGYLGGAPSGGEQPHPTGDLGRIDDDGFLYVEGRKKNVFITAYGRNVSPEWVEAELAQSAAVSQAVLFGEARPVNLAVIAAVSPDTEDQAIQRAVDEANARLPDYARVAHWVRAEAPFAPENGLATANGRPRRTAIYTHYRQALEALAPGAGGF